MEHLYAGLVRWGHITTGITWIGLLYYFNLVQMAALKDAGVDGTAAGITKHVAPRALLWFRWAAVATWILGIALLTTLGDKGGSVIHKTFTLQAPYAGIGIGSWLGTIMLFNVWHFIWPNQKKILGMVSATDEVKVKARRIAMLASRTNLMLSLPMLYFMANSFSHRIG